MLKLFSAIDLFSSELPTTKTWGFPSIYFRGQVEVKCQCEKEGRIKSPIKYYFGIQCPVNTNKSVLLEFVGVFLLLKLRPHGKQLTISRCETERTISSTEKLYFSQWGGLLQLGFTQICKEKVAALRAWESQQSSSSCCVHGRAFAKPDVLLGMQGRSWWATQGEPSWAVLTHTSRRGPTFTSC